MTEAIAVSPRPRPIAVSWMGSLKILLRADITVQLRNKQSLLLTFALPMVMLVALFAGKRAAASALGDPKLRVAEAITLGLVTAGVLGYSMAVAQDREHGVFQRLRVTPTPAWTIMASRFAVQVASMLVMAVLVLVVASVFVHVTLAVDEYALTLLAVAIGAAVFLSIGQAVVGLVRSAATLNAFGRFILVPIIGLTLLGHIDLLGTTVEYIARWSPGGAFSTLLAGAMNPSTWAVETWGALLASLGYTAVFAGVGIRWFRWTAR
jgi:ABC-2 type transport system permease protein